MNIITLDDITDLDQYLAENPNETKVQPAWMYQQLVIDRMYGVLANIGSDLPWSKTHGNIKLRPGELSVWAGVNGHGKSLLLNQIMLNCMAQGHRVIIASMEMPPASTMIRMVKQASGRTNPTEQFIIDFHDWTADKLWLYTQTGTVSAKFMLAVIRYCMKSLRSAGVRMPPHHIVIDSLMKCGMGVDEYNKQKWFVDELTTLCQDYNMHIHLVAHSRKRENEKGIMDKFDVKGAGDITDMADNVFTVWRNKSKEVEAKKPAPRMDVMEKPDCILNCDKQRHGDWEGRIALWFHPSGQYVSGPDKPPIPFVNEYQQTGT